MFRYKAANKQPDVQSNVRINGFWTRQRNSFFDFTVFYPFARSYLSKTPTELYMLAANSKRREYEERLNVVENSDFVPMVMSSSGGMGKHMTSAIKRLALKIAEK